LELHYLIGDVSFVALSFRRLHHEARWGPLPGYAHVGRSTRKRRRRFAQESIETLRARARGGCPTCHHTLPQTCLLPEAYPVRFPRVGVALFFMPMSVLEFGKIEFFF
jgi:hypothetical protein